MYVEQHLPWYEILKQERTKRGWSQQDVADKIGSAHKSIRRWESGQIFPGPFNRQKLAEIFGKSVEELRLVKREDASDVDRSGSRQEDWGEAPDIRRFYGRARELEEIKRWILDERCQLVALLGIGGVGKTTLATVAAQQMQRSQPFEYVYWRSLQNAPSVEHLLENCLQNLYTQRPVEFPHTLDEQISLLIAYLRQHRCLLILDNVESVLQSDPHAGVYIKTDKGYGSLFQRIGESSLASCLLITSREKPQEIARLEGSNSPVRSQRLDGIEQSSGQELLQNEDLSGTADTRAALVERYSGNPLALKIVAEPIREVFGGNIAAFLKEEESVFGDIYDLLEQQFRRLAVREREIIYWLAIERESVSLGTLQEDMQHLLPQKVLFEGLDSLRRRSLIEVSGEGHFILQPVVMEYVTEKFIESIGEEIAGEAYALFGSHALMKARAVDYVRRSQVRFILRPVISKLHATFGKANSEQRLKQMLATLNTNGALQHSYAAGNILNLLIQSGTDLHGLDLSNLTVRQADLQGVSLLAVNFSAADLETCTFTDTFGSMLCLALSPDGTLMATGMTTDEVRLWQTQSVTALFRCSGHTDEVRSVVFSPDGKTFASGSEDHTLRLWESATGRCLKTLEGHTNWVLSVAFSPDGRMLASASVDQTVRIWDPGTGECLRILQGHTGWVRTVAFSPDGNALASGGEDQTIRFWDPGTGECLHILQGHTGWVRTVAFSPDGNTLASGGEDQTIRLWDPSTGACLRILQGHTRRVRTIAWSSDGTLLASAGDDQLIRLWNVHTGDCFKVLPGHTNRIWSISFIPASKTLVSASEDDTMRFWDTQSGQCTRTLQGQTSLIKAVAFSPDGQRLVSGSEDQCVRLWDSNNGQCIKTLRKHENRVRCVTFNPNGTTFASGSEDETICIWDAHSTQILKVLRGHTNLVRAVAFSPEGRLLASGSYDRTIRIWDAETGQCLKTLDGYTLTWSVSFSPDGKTLASGGDDGIVRLWDTETGASIQTLEGHTNRVWSVAFHPSGETLASSGDDQTIRIWKMSTGVALNVLQGHTSWVRSVAFSPDGSRVASGSHDQTVRIWDSASGQCLNILRGHTGFVCSVAFNPITDTLASCGDDGSIKLWNIRTGECEMTLRSEKLYEQMNITHVKGLTDPQKASLKILGAVDYS